jgi:hypothetical protein
MSMNLVSATDNALRSSVISDVIPVVFVVDDDISVREALDSLICTTGC